MIKCVGETVHFRSKKALYPQYIFGPESTEISAQYFSSNDLFQKSNESISLQMHEAYQQTPIHGADRWVVEVDISSNI